MPSTTIKDPDSVLDYQFDWATSWLDAAETVTSHTVTASAGITVDSTSETGGVVTVWLSGGTAGVNYTLACLIVTSAGRTDERTMTIRVRDR